MSADNCIELSPGTLVSLVVRLVPFVKAGELPFGNDTCMVSLSLSENTKIKIFDHTGLTNTVILSLEPQRYAVTVRLLMEILTKNHW